MSKSPLIFLLLCILSSAAQCFASDEAESVELGGLSRRSFPKDFVFGTAASAYQVEGMASKGGRGPSIWDSFIKEPGREPNNASGEVSVDQYHKYKEDIDLMAKLNFDAYRFQFHGLEYFQVNKEGVAYYNRLINYMLKKGITPYPNLNHYDLPLALQDRYNGWLGRQVVEDFADYAEFCFKTFGDRVKNWQTFNEPRVVAALGYDNGFFAPGRCSKAFGNCTEGNSATEPYIVAHNLILCHAAAVQRYREKSGLCILWCMESIQKHAEHRRKRLPKFTKEEVKMVKGSFDFVGINQYTAYYMYDAKQTNSKDLGYQQDWQCGFACEKLVQLHLAAHSYWLYIVPWGLYKAVNYIKERYGNPTMILAENGMDQPGNLTIPKVLHDTVRINYYKSYLLELKKSIKDGANVIGYFQWTFVDNFEWRLGYTSRFGIVYVDFKTLKRYPKMSAYWFKRLQQRDKH
ncbi:UNVERIFIED_CONTAM: Beta-glucosidase 44 [Sesamum radiatum]|uniref:Beta-glucosidase 44 n=1 Tax=Sesamum radiatum TaxID=300843 RepID=A0AAW2V8Q8_SESRA